MDALASDPAIQGATTEDLHRVWNARFEDVALDVLVRQPNRIAERILTDYRRTNFKDALFTIWEERRIDVGKSPIGAER